MAIQPVEMTIDEIQQIYGIKTSTAYKWRKFLRDNDLAVDRENCDRINSRDLVMTEAVSIVTVEEPLNPVIQPVDNANQMTALGITVGRLQEINNNVELEVEITERLRELHQSKRQSAKSQELQQKIKEVQHIDPKNLESMLSSLGIA
jgi:transposase-like protein